MMVGCLFILYLSCALGVEGPIPFSHQNNLVHSRLRNRTLCVPLPGCCLLCRFVYWLFFLLVSIALLVACFCELFVVYYPFD